MWICDQGERRCVGSFSDFMYAPLTGPFPSQAHIYTFLHTCATLSQARVHTMGSVSILPGSEFVGNYGNLLDVSDAIPLLTAACALGPCLQMHMLLIVGPLHL